MGVEGEEEAEAGGEGEEGVVKVALYMYVEYTLSHALQMLYRAYSHLNSLALIGCPPGTKLTT